jgi:hypothetical protein
LIVSESILVVVPCGTAKIWKHHPDQGPTPAKEAYVGAPFKVNREFAERHGDAWVVLSAKYGFMAPTFVIPGAYEVTFKDPSTCPVDYAKLAEQVREMHLEGFDRVIGLGGADYRQAIRAAFESTNARLEFPTAGLRIGEAMRAIKHYDPRQDK